MLINRQTSNRRPFLRRMAAAVTALGLSSAALFTATPTQAQEATTAPTGAADALTAAGVTPDEVVPGKYYKLYARASGQVMDVAGASWWNGARVIQWSSNDGWNQRWKLESYNGHYRLVNRESDKCLAVPGASTRPDVGLIQWDCGSGAEQQFSLFRNDEGYYVLTWRHSGQAVDLPHGTNLEGTQLVQYYRNGGLYQQWAFVQG
jgi:hypothetical protein